MSRYEFRSYSGGYAKSEDEKIADKCWNRIVRFAEEQGYKVIRYRSPNKGQFYIDNFDTKHKDWPYYFSYYGWKICEAESDLDSRYWIVNIMRKLTDDEYEVNYNCGG